MRRILASMALAIGLVISGAAAANAGGSGDFYYGTCYGGKVGTFYGQATNYDKGTGQEYHWAMKSLPSGYYPYWVDFNGSKTYAPTIAYAGYKYFSNKATDHTITVAAKNSSGKVITSTISYLCWR